MSIELNNPKSVLEKIDAAANFVAQMQLAYMVNDGQTFRNAFKRASELLFEAAQQIQEEKNL